MASGADVTHGEPGSAGDTNPSTAVNPSDTSIVGDSSEPSNAKASIRPHLQAEVHGGSEHITWKGDVRVLHPGPKYEFSPLEIISIPVWWPDFDVDYDTIMSFAFATTGVSSEEHIHLSPDRDEGGVNCEKHVKLKAGTYYLFVDNEPYNIAETADPEKVPEDVNVEDIVRYDRKNYPILKTITDWIAPTVRLSVPNTRVRGNCFLPSAWQRVKKYDFSFEKGTQCQVTGLRYALQRAHVIPKVEGVSDWWATHMLVDKKVSLGDWPNIMMLQHPIHHTLDSHNITFAALPVAGCPERSTRLALIVPEYDVKAHDVITSGVVNDLHRRELHCDVDPTWLLLHNLYLRFIWTFIWHQYRKRLARTSRIILLRSSIRHPNFYYVVDSKDEREGMDKGEPLSLFLVPSSVSSTSGRKKRKSESSSYTGTPSHQSSPGPIGPPAARQRSSVHVWTPPREGRGQQAKSDDMELDDGPIFKSVEDWLYRTPDNGLWPEDENHRA